MSSTDEGPAKTSIEASVKAVAELWSDLRTPDLRSEVRGGSQIRARHGTRLNVRRKMLRAPLILRLWNRPPPRIWADEAPPAPPCITPQWPTGAAYKELYRR